MEARQRFGKYLLFKRLTGDELGESFRAGRVGPQGVDRVVLLRLFNGAKVDRDALWKAISERPPLQAALRSPQLGAGVELGVEDDIPFVAYDYVSGKSLAQLRDQSRDKPFPIPVEHALFIVERTAQGLAAAWDQKIKGERLVHGFLSPDWVWLSSEGEVRLLGLDVAAGLRSLSPEARQSPTLRPYLSPEVAGGAAPTALDDIYSLGAILFEMLTGRPLPIEDPATAIGGAVLAAEGTELAQPMRELLRKSVGPRDDRIESPDRWRAQLAALISEGEYNPTTFNLAFFLHTLFRGEIEKESEEIQKEKTGEFIVDTPLPEAPAAAAAPPVAAPAVPPRPGTGELRVPLDSRTPATGTRVAGVAKARSKGRQDRKKLILGAAAALAVALIGGGAYYYFAVMQPAGGGESVAAATPMPVTTPAAPSFTLDSAAEDVTAEEGVPPIGEPTDAGSDLIAVDAIGAPPPTPDEIEAQVRALVAKGVGEMEASLKTEYEQRLAELRLQLEDARKNAAQREAGRSRSGGEPVAGGAAATSPGAAAVPTTDVQQAAAGTDGSAGAPRTGGQAGTPPAGEPAARSASQSPTEGASGESSGSTAGAQAPTTQRAASTSAPPAPTVAPPPKRGDLVEPGPGVIPPRMVRRPRPIYPPAARKFAKRATVKLRVLVDENGAAARVEQISSPARFGFDDAAAEAAKDTTWIAATKEGVPVKMWVELTIEFRP